MNGCVVVFYGLVSHLWVYSSIAPKRSRDRFRLHRSPDQDKVVTEERMNNLNWIIDKDTDIASVLSRLLCGSASKAGLDEQEAVFSFL